METVSPEDFKPEDSTWFFDALHSYSVTYANTNFRFDVSLAHGLRDIMPIETANSIIHEGLDAGDLVLVEGGERETLYALLKSDDKLYSLQIPRTFPEIDEGHTKSVLREFTINTVGSDDSSPQIRISGKRVGSRRDPETITIVPSARTFGVLRAKFPPVRAVSYLRSK